MLINKDKTGKIIKKLREEKNISQEELAKFLDIPRPSVSQLENGLRDICLLEFSKLLKIFQISYDEFVGEGNSKAESGSQVSKPINKKIKFEPEKFKQLILYILEKCGNKPNVGETVLYKLLYFCDFDYFELFEKPLTGMIYKKLQFGPVPCQDYYNKVVREMVDDKQIAIVMIPLNIDIIQRKYVNLTGPNLSLFNVDELDLVNKVINRLSDMNARQIEDHSHKDYPWIAHEYDQEIDYSSVFNRTGEFAQRDYDEEFIETGLADASEGLEDGTKEEYDYYMSLPDKDENN